MYDSWFSFNILYYYAVEHCSNVHFINNIEIDILLAHILKDINELKMIISTRRLCVCVCENSHRDTTRAKMQSFQLRMKWSSVSKKNEINNTSSPFSPSLSLSIFLSLSLLIKSSLNFYSPSFKAKKYHTTTI